MRSNKTLDSSSSKIISKKTLGSFNTFSFSCLGLSSYRKYKAKAAKHHKSSFKNSFKPSDHSCSSRSRNVSLISTMLVNGDPFHISQDLEFWVLIAMSLLYFSILKLMCCPFDKVRCDLHAFMLKQLI